jgi:hypothetical protein
MTTTTTTDILADLDAQLDDTVPCEWSSDVDCDQPAEWQITYTVGPFIPPQHLFACTPHKEHLVHHATSCPNCSRLITVESAVRIR